MPGCLPIPGCRRLVVTVRVYCRLSLVWDSVLLGVTELLKDGLCCLESKCQITANPFMLQARRAQKEKMKQAVRPSENTNSGKQWA